MTRRVGVGAKGGLLPLQSAAGWVAMGAVAVAALGVSYGDRDFAKIHWGPLYVCEAAFLVAVFGALVADWRFFLRAIRGVRWAYAFFAWGLVLMLNDVLLGDGNWSATLLNQRLLQHCLLFFYPAMWMTIGAWFPQHFRRETLFLVFAIFGVNVLQQFLSCFGVGWVKMSAGTLAVLWALQLLWVGKQWFGAAVGLVVSFFPFWVAFAHSALRRTSFAILVIELAVVPWVFFAQKKSNKDRLRRTVLTSGIALVLLFGGIGGALFLQRSETGGVSSQFIGAMQHGEDRPIAGDPTVLFEARVRRFMWGQAISQWLEHPIVGVGFVPEVPSHVYRGVPNDLSYRPGEPPLSGPHNSYLTVLARMGAIGFLLFLAMGFGWIRQISPLLKAKVSPLLEALLIFIPLNGFIYALFNVGLESPHNAILVWLTVGFGMTLGQTAFVRANH